jgi:hypothetical protein
VILIRVPGIFRLSLFLELIFISFTSSLRDPVSPDQTQKLHHYVSTTRHAPLFLLCLHGSAVCRGNPAVPRGIFCSNVSVPDETTCAPAARSNVDMLVSETPRLDSQACNDAKREFAVSASQTQVSPIAV